MCESTGLARVLVLTPTPPGNNFLTAAELDAPEPSYPLELHQCGDCHHVQLGHVVDPRILYQRNYTYVSATGSSFVEHLRQYASDMTRTFGLGPGPNGRRPPALVRSALPSYVDPTFGFGQSGPAAGPRVLPGQHPSRTGFAADRGIVRS